MTIYKAVNSDKKEINIKGSEGFYAADFVYAFPPDVPILIPGERITGEKIDMIISLRDNGADIRGVHEDRVTVAV